MTRSVGHGQSPRALAAGRPEACDQTALQVQASSASGTMPGRWPTFSLMNLPDVSLAIV